MRAVGVVLDVVLDDVPLDVIVVVVMFGGELDHFAFIFVGKVERVTRQSSSAILGAILDVLNGVLNGGKVCKVC